MDNTTTPPTPIDVSLTHGLRVFRNTHRTCQGEDVPAGTDLGCTLEGYWPGRPADLDCEVDETEFAYCISDDITPGAGNPVKPSYIQYMPFAEGHNPTNFCDYAEWQQVAFGVCNLVANRAAPGGTTYWNPTPLGQGPYCGFAPSFAEPDDSGFCVLPLSAPGLNDRTDRPALYDPAPASTCEF